MLVKEVTFANQNITSELSIGTFIPACDCTVKVRCDLGTTDDLLVGEAANFTFTAYITREATAMKVFDSGALAKPTAANTRYSQVLNSSFTLKAGETLDIKALSSLAGDSSVGGSVKFFDEYDAGSVPALHVHSSGLDVNTGMSKAGAKLLIASVVTAGADGDTIVVWPGTYISAVSVSKSIHLLGRHRKGCLVLVGAVGAVACTLSDYGAIVENFTLTSYAGSTVSTGALYINSNGCTARHLDIVLTASAETKYGIFCASTAVKTRLEDIYLTSDASGMLIDGSDFVGEDLTIICTNARSGVPIGVKNQGTMTRLKGGTIYVKNDQDNAAAGATGFENDTTNGSDTCIMSDYFISVINEHANGAAVTTGIVAETPMILDNCDINVRNDGAGATYGLKADDDALLDNCKIEVTASTDYSIFVASGKTVKCQNCIYDHATVGGDGTVIDVIDANGRVDVATANGAALLSAADVVNEWETQSQAAPTGFQVNVKMVNDTAQTANDNSADIISIKEQTDKLNSMIEEDSAGNYFTTEALINAPGSDLTASDIVDEWETQSQAAPLGFWVNVKFWRDAAVVANTIPGTPVVDLAAMQGITTYVYNLVTLAKTFKATSGEIVSATSTSQFIIGAGATTDDTYNGMLITLKDETTQYYETRRITDYTGATREVFVDRAFSFLPVITDDFIIMNIAYGDVNISHVGGTAQTANDNSADIISIKEQTDKFDNMITEDSSGNYFTTEALVNAPDTSLTAQEVWEYTTRILTASTNFNDITVADVVTAMEDNGSKLDQLWEMTEDDGGTRRLTSNALEESPASGLTEQQALDLASIKEQTDKLDNMIDEDSTGNQFTIEALTNAPDIGGGATAQEVWEYATRILTAGTNLNFAPPNEYDTEMARITADVATEAKQDIIDTNVNSIKEQTDKLDNMIDEQSGANAFTTEALANVVATATVDSSDLAEAMLAITGVTVGGTWTWEKIMKIAAAWAAGDWRRKVDDPTVQELLDAEDGSTVILEQSLTRAPTAGNNYRDITVKI